MTLFSHTSQMPFGRYRGKQMQDVPAIYLLWLYDKGCTDRAIRQYVEMEYKNLVKEAGNKRVKTSESK
jgi:uncharacterized protein (DUF3820 family)